LSSFSKNFETDLFLLFNNLLQQTFGLFKYSAPLVKKTARLMISLLC